MNTTEKHFWIYSVLIGLGVLILIFALLSPRELTHGRSWNQATALGGLLLAAMVFLLGPFSRLFPRFFARFLGFRKPLGLLAFGLILFHSLYSLVTYYELNLDKMLFANPKLTAFLAAVGSLLIFTAMALTSRLVSMQQMGYSNWKKLQQTGYIALGLGIIHFILIETRAAGFVVPPIALMVLFVAVVALVLRVLMRWHSAAPHSHYDAHFTSQPASTPATSKSNEKFQKKN